jgi:predicted ester cyclase
MTVQIDTYKKNKELTAKLRHALYDCEAGQLELTLSEVFSPDARVHLAYPFEDLNGPSELYAKVFTPLMTALPDLERRDFIVIGGSADTGDWVGTAGYYTGVFEKPWLDIPPTKHPVFMRYCEFFRVEGDKVVEMQALWDIPQVMMQARAWPMAPSLGVEWLVPGPATQDGIVSGPYDKVKSTASQTLVANMLASLGKFSKGGHEAMNLEAYWHPKMTWYGPAGIGTNRRVSGFRNWHQIPFLNAMPDREGGVGENIAFFGDGDYVGFTAWPGMRAKISGNGWMGIAPGNQEITIRSLDFWRCENGTIRENWVLVDILDVYSQIGVDVFSRMREYTVDRQQVQPEL